VRKAVTVALSPSHLPAVSYGPLRLMEAVPWLMFASAMRIVAVTGGIITLLALIFATIAIFLAFLLAARRMIELTDGETCLGRVNFHEQLVLARKVLGQVVVLTLAGCLALAAAGARSPAMAMLNGVDGIAFDQFSAFGMGWSALLAAVMLVMILKTESAGKVTLLEAFRELWRRSVFMVPAIIILATTYLACMSSGTWSDRRSSCARWCSSFLSSALRRSGFGRRWRSLLSHCASPIGVDF
jgi:hypothetical protein